MADYFKKLPPKVREPFEKEAEVEKASSKRTKGKGSKGKGKDNNSEDNSKGKGKGKPGDRSAQPNIPDPVNERPVILMTALSPEEMAQFVSFLIWKWRYWYLISILDNIGNMAYLWLEMLGKSLFANVTLLIVGLHPSQGGQIDAVSWVLMKFLDILR